MAFRVVPYSDAWPLNFATARDQLQTAFGDVAPRIEHVGSTSVPGLCAKPVIDILVGADSLEAIEAAIPSLVTAGFSYVDKYEAVLPMRRYFVKNESSLPRVHVHGVKLDSDFWREHLAFRDLLRRDAHARDAYARLKLELAVAHAEDKSAYTEAKGPFIREMLTAARSRGLL